MYSKNAIVFQIDEIDQLADAEDDDLKGAVVED